ncbi:UNVERIFIED_CONTAM: hypothetical protein FKN15_039371 [Acipenser sinensis]
MRVFPTAGENNIEIAPPKFTRTPDDQTGVSGGVASFICQATGDPRPKIVWNKKGKKVSNQRFEVIEFDDGSGSVLRIQPLRTPRDEAIYECVASNSVGETSSSTRLTVLRGRSSFVSNTQIQITFYFWISSWAGKQQDF